MDQAFKEHFLQRWRKYFRDADLPVTYCYTDDLQQQEQDGDQEGDHCLISNVVRVQHDGVSYSYDLKTPGCPGGKRFSGFIEQLRPGFEYFLSCGIPGKMEGERYKRSPELVNQFVAQNPVIQAPGKYLVFKRWDRLGPDDEPLVVVFLARPDVLSGLFTLANYDLADTPGVITPMGAGCAAILQYPLREIEREQPRCVLGMFDVSARPCLPADRLSFAVPMKRFIQLVDYMDESFLITEAWGFVRDRL